MQLYTPTHTHTNRGRQIVHLQTGPQPHHAGTQAEHATKLLGYHVRHTARKLTVECVLPPNVHGELERVPSISRRHSNGVDVRAGVRVDLDQRLNLCKHLQRRAEVHIHREDFSLVVGAGDVCDHVGVHLVVGVQHSAAVPLDQRGVQQGYLLHLHHA